MITILNNVRETTVTAGKANFVLGGPAAGYRPFWAVVGEDAEVGYYAWHRKADQYEAGIGRVVGKRYLRRDTVLKSSNENGLVDFTNGIKDVYLVDPAIYRDEHDDHGQLAGLADDDHTQYLLLAGRAGGQTVLTGGDANVGLSVKSNSATQSAHLFRTLDESSNVRVSIDHNGVMTVDYNATSNSNVAVLKLGRRRSGSAPTGGFGGHLLMQADTSTNTLRDVGRLQWQWSDITDASRKGLYLFYVEDSGGSREAFRIQSDGTVAQFGFGGATSANVKVQLYTGSDTTKGLVVRGNSATQSANLIECVEGTGSAVVLTVGPLGVLGVAPNDSATAATTVGLTVGHNSTGTPAAGFGSELRFAAESTTSIGRNVGAIQAVWVDATDASRKGRVIGQVYDTTAKEFLRAESDGTSALLAIGTTVASATRLLVVPGADGNKCLVLKGNSSSQTANLFECQNSSATILLSVAADGTLSTQVRDAGTTTAPVVLTVRHNSSGTPAAGFGAAVKLQAESSTTEDRDVYEVAATWETATDASRKGRVVQSVHDATAAREFLRAESDGSGSNVSLFGAGSWGGGRNVVFLADAAVVPTTNPSGGGILYVEGGALKFRGSSGTVTTLGIA